MSLSEIWIFRLLVLLAAGLFGWQMATRYKLFARAANNIDTSNLGTRAGTFLAEVVPEAQRFCSDSIRFWASYRSCCFL